ncbi:MAG: hypothetical protein L0332_24560 [Chloroflexi bacterium]|nr:hypothetical protein [Chloroflexota bacterium]MCI0579878.1 hypothetical protein [Chloroflexota bacterium]MCI0646159.1 hypothetical protein [Chloroflexota bacterium]MCI0729869.1 hypothetical protein [Chloroflexota bacterium]
MAKSNLIRLSGLAAIVGGTLLIGSVVAIAFQPEGCIASECGLPGRSMREWSAPAPFFIMALLLITMGAAGLVIRARAAGHFGISGRVGQSSGLIGVALLALGGGIQELFFGGDFPLMPVFVIPGLLALVTGFLLIGITILRANTLPRQVVWLLIAATLAMAGFNDQNARVLMAAPLGMAWMAIGYALWVDEHAGL